MNENLTPNEPNQPDVDALLQAAAQPGTPAELANMSAMVQQFTAAVTAPVEAPASAAPAARGVSRFAGRVTRRAAVMAGVGLFVAGTAAAAAGGVLPKALTAPFHSAPRAELLPTATTVTGSTVAGSTTTAVSGSTVPSGTLVTGSSIPADDDGTEQESDEATEHAGRLFGLCQAWTDGVAKDPTLKPFHHLAEAAAAKNQTVEQFCADVLANPPASTLPDDDDHHNAVEHAARLFGMCQAWTDAVAQNPDLKPFHHLAEAAAAKNQTVAQFCTDVLANPPAPVTGGSVPVGSLPQWTPGQGGHGQDGHGGNNGQGSNGSQSGNSGHGGGHGNGHAEPTTTVTTVPTTAG